MSILLANHTDIYNQRLAWALINRGLPIGTIITSKSDFFSHKKLPKNLTIFDVYNFYYTDRIAQLNKNNTHCLSKNDIGEYQELLTLFLKISDRLTFKPISVRHRCDLFYELLLYWLTYFKEQQITLVVFAQTPHTGYDNIIYEIAKKQKIPTIIVCPTLISDRILIRTDYLINSKVPITFKKHANSKELITLIDPILYQDAFNEGPWRKTGKEINRTVTANNSGNVLSRFITRWVPRLLKNPIKIITSLGQRSSNSGTVFNGNYTLLMEFCITVYYYFRKKELATEYKRLSSSVNLAKKYIYFALHYQPERTTLPEGDVFENQWLALKILSRSVPKDWIIYVKEHPRQFALNDIRTNNFRDTDYYRKLLSLPNVYLAEVTESSENLIKHSQCVSSIQGSASWESLLLSKPTIIFASAWFGACRSCYQVDSIESCKKALKQIRGKIKSKDIVRTDLLKYILYIEKDLVTSAFYNQPAQSSKIEYDTLINNLATAIQKQYTQKN